MSFKLINILKEALDVSWNPFEEVNYTNKVYEFVDFDYGDSESGPTVLVFFRDEDGDDLGAIVDIETGKILDASTWSGEGDEDVNLHLKVVEQLNQNISIKKVLDLLIKSLKEGLDRKGVRTEALDVSWNPYEDNDYTVSMGKLDKDHIILRHYTAKDERGALVEYFMEALGQDSEYAEIAVNGTKEIKLKNSTGYRDKHGDFFWIVAKGDHNEDYMINLNKEYKQKYNI